VPLRTGCGKGEEEEHRREMLRKFHQNRHHQEVSLSLLFDGWFADQPSRPPLQCMGWITTTRSSKTTINPESKRSPSLLKV
jgi:hypothetical protein